MGNVLQPLVTFVNGLGVSAMQLSYGLGICLLLYSVWSAAFGEHGMMKAILSAVIAIAIVGSAPYIVGALTP